MLRNSYQNDKPSCVNIKVIVRCRPLNEKEKNDVNNEEVVKIEDNEVILTLNRNNEIYEKKYSFDYACDKDVDQRTLFNNYVFRIVDEVLEGFNCTLFCYGQTGTGKTYTMEGKILEHLKHNESKKIDLSDSINSDINYYYELCDSDDTGIIFRVAKRIFDILNRRKEYKSTKFVGGEEEGDISWRRNSCVSEAEEINQGVVLHTEVNTRGDSVLHGDRETCPPKDLSTRESTEKSELFDPLEEKKEESSAGDIYNVEKSSYDFVIKVSYLEIYNEELCDLLSTSSESNRLKIYEDTTNKNKGLNVDKLEEKCINSFEEIYYLICSAIRKRRTAETSYNKKSSRSHSIFTITLIMKDLNNDGESITRIGKLNLVDLAGSENALKSSYGNLKVRQQESCNINQSLLTLGRVINALIENSSYIPYRDSKLTRLLQDSLGGKTKTFIVATISPSSLCIDETLSTLDYVFRAKNIKNRPEINVKTTKQLKIKDLNNEIEKLKNALHLSREKRGVYLDNEEYNNIQNSLKKNKEILLQKEKILFEKSKKIKTLLNKMDYTDDVQNQIVHLLKDVLSKCRNIQLIHDTLVNRLSEEKCVTRFLLSEFLHAQGEYQRKVNLLTQAQRNISCLFRETVSNFKRGNKEHFSTLSEICNIITTVLGKAKVDITQGKENIMKSLDQLERLNRDTILRENKLLRFLLDKVDAVEKHDQNCFLKLGEITQEFLACKVDLTQVSTPRSSDPTSNRRNDLLDSANSSKKTPQPNDHRTGAVLTILRDLAQCDEAAQVLRKIERYQTTEESTVKDTLQNMQNVSKLLHLYLKHSFEKLKNDMEKKIETLDEERQKLTMLLEQLRSDYESFEASLSKRKDEMVETYRTSIGKYMDLFQNQVMEEVKTVIQRNVSQMNEIVNRKIHLLSNQLHEESKNKFKEIITDSISTLETFFLNHEKACGTHHQDCLESTDLMYEKVNSYYEHLDGVFTDMDDRFANEKREMERNVQNVTDMYRKIIQENNENIEKIGNLLDINTSNNRKDKEVLYNDMSKAVFREKYELDDRMKEVGELTLRHMKEINLCNGNYGEHLNKCNLYVGELLQRFRENEEKQKDECVVLPNLDSPIQHEGKDIHAEVERVRSCASEIFSHLGDPTSGGAKSGGATSGGATSGDATSDGAMPIDAMPIDATLSGANMHGVDPPGNACGTTDSPHTCPNPYADLHFDHVRQEVLKEIEDMSLQKNINFKYLFDKIDEHLSLILNENNCVRHRGGSIDLSRGENIGGVMAMPPTAVVATPHVISVSCPHVSDILPRTGHGKCSPSEPYGNVMRKGTTDGETQNKNEKKASGFFHMDDPETNMHSGISKILPDCNKKRNKSTETVQGRKLCFTSNELRNPCAKIKSLGNSGGSRKNSPAPKKLKEDTYNGRGIKFLRKSEN
ncbi:kinesin-5, putative [Plasmodium knowlesi strain H]|uniref:Kinesin-5, putative n=3 Tax=Plasmodium knowlesi TaxID=5850 RepID=A0A5K1V7Z2_PLAKH|nr:kinesin-5, putative [Plasmodium knowlesi strain H]OTN66047.1 putative Kinesin-5 [Plasmodium knowlesi]CAA9987886.1 kinesin-5, putative [Plasmodium knowlesi strain H]SBO22269.1 kinesin-5, putative [Plasmodium knowlesi strain H]SBO28819.1 kinesin-5, putative [Plasmodium knowlesi strain H]VVS77360.1 kinesin-5, putative [Plasmodium knowlesi strain H]|eukprot:XP_002258884.1 kinesin-related protein, putative [Plasmodium knowlesi strain H]